MTIKKLIPNDLPALEALLFQDNLHNIHQIYDIEANGLPKDQNKFWGIFDGDKLHSVFFSENFRPEGYGLLASARPLEALPLLDFAFRNNLRSVIWTTSCPQNIVDGYKEKVTDIHRWRFYKCGPDDLDPSYKFSCRMATNADIDSLVELYYDYEFAAHGGSTTELRRQIRESMNKGGKYFCIEIDSKIVVSALVYSETSDAALIGSARTLPDYRGKGLYRSLRTACFEYLFNKNKIAVGFFVEKNYKIQKLVEKYGGTFLEDWSVFENRRKKPHRLAIVSKKIKKALSRMKSNALQ